MTEAEDRAKIETGRQLFARPVTFLRSVVGLEHLPTDALPEVCFAGRSNVGKSSLINAVCNQKGLARSSNTPGRTRELNYFSVADRIYLVDLPGYGYAKAPKADIARWTALTRAYLRGRAGLRRVFLLIDARHGIKDTDIELMDMLGEAAVTFQIILTKADKLKKGQAEAMLKRTHAQINKRAAAHPVIILTSSEKKTGIDAIRAEIAALALDVNPL